MPPGCVGSLKRATGVLKAVFFFVLLEIMATGIYDSPERLTGVLEAGKMVLGIYYSLESLTGVFKAIVFF